MHWHDYRFTKRSELFVSFTIRVVKIKIEKMFLIACAVIIFIFSLIITFFDVHGESYFYFKVAVRIYMEFCVVA